MTTQDLGLAARQLSEMEAAYKDTFEAMEAKYASVQAEAAALRTERDTALARIAELEAEMTLRATAVASLCARLEVARAANDALRQERDAMQKLSAERIAELVSRDLVAEAFESIGGLGDDDLQREIGKQGVARCCLLLGEALGR